MKKLFWLCLFTLSLHGDPVDMRSKMVVRGQATLHKPADELRFTIGVVTQNETAEEALSENNEKMNRVVASLEKEGLMPSEYETGQFSLHPVFSQRPPSEDAWTPSIIAYQVQNSLNIKTSQLEKAALFLDAAHRGGANSTDNLQFTLKDPRQYRDEAITEAANHAMEDAKSLANATKQKLVRILDLTLDETAPESPIRNLSFAKAGGSSTPIHPGLVEVSASVSIQYEIN